MVVLFFLRSGKCRELETDDEVVSGKAQVKKRERVTGGNGGGTTTRKDVEPRGPKKRGHD